MLPCQYKRLTDTLIHAKIKLNKYAKVGGIHYERIICARIHRKWQRKKYSGVWFGFKSLVCHGKKVYIAQFIKT